MKKILFVLSLTITFFANAQDNWQTVEGNGFNMNVTFWHSQTFQNKLFVAGDTSSDILLYSSPTGVPGTFTEEIGIKAVLQGVNETSFSSSASDASYLFFGSKTFYDTLGGSVKPQVYRYDGSVYTKHGTLPLVMQPSDNYAGPTIGSLALYSPTGSNDTVYAFVSPGYPRPLEVWKAPANQTNPPWINATIFSPASGITMIYDSKVWKNKLYIAVCNAANGGMILRTADGANWDTVTTGLSMTALLGPNAFTTSFTALEIYDHKLVASVINSYNGIGLVYTSDSLAATQTWSGLIDSASFSGLTSTWVNINDLHATPGRLWLLATVQSFFSPTIYMVSKNALNRDTITHSSGSTNVESATNAGGSYTLTDLNNHVFATGHTAPASLRSQDPTVFGPSNYPGNIFSFYMVNPTASFIDSVYSGTGFCEYNTVYLVSTSINAASYQWFLNGAHYSYAQDTMFYSPTAGSFTFELIAYNGTQQSSFKDSVTQVITINPNPMVGGASASSYTVCQGQPDSLFVNVVGGSSPYTYTWHNAYDNIDYPGADTTVITLYTVPSFSPYIYMSFNVKDANNCPLGNPPVLYIYVNASDSLSGAVIDTSLNSVNAGKVYLFKLNSLNPQPGDTTGVFNLPANGYYSFPALYYGSYIVKAIADTSNALYKTSVGTYYSNKTYPFQWDSALVIQHHSCVNGNAGGNDIKILQMPPVITGPGTITGIIEYDSTYTGARLAGGGGFLPMGAPLKGVDVKLGRNPGGSPAARTTTNQQGQFTFTNIPLGNYRIYVDIPNYGMDSVRVVTLDTANSMSIDNNYYVDSTMIRVIPVFNTLATICQGDSIMVGGAYQTLAGAYSDTLNEHGHDSVVVTTLSLKPLPTFILTTSADTVCIGSSAVLSITGNATSYLWSANAGSATTTTVSISPGATDIYVATGTLNGCFSSQSIVVVAKNCIGIQNFAQSGFRYYPNPAIDKFSIESDKAGSIRLINITGQVALEQKIQLGRNEINISSLPAGAYELSRNVNGQITTGKLMINK